MCRSLTFSTPPPSGNTTKPDCNHGPTGATSALCAGCFETTKRMNRWISKLVLRLAAPAKAYNVVGPNYGLPKFKNFIDLIEGDHTLLADIPDWVGFRRSAFAALHRTAACQNRPTNPG